MARAGMLIFAVALAAAACGGTGSSSPDAGAGGADAPRPTVDAARPVDARPDDTDAAIPDSCDPVTQLGCNPGQKCSIIPGSPPRIGCVSDQGNLGQDQACSVATSTTPDMCSKGLVCRGNTTPICQAFCSDDPTDTCGQSYSCVFGFDLDGDFVTDYQLCGANCEVLVQDCLSGQGCYPSSGGEVCAEEGAGSTPVPEGGICPYANSCEVGTGCFRLGGPGSDYLCFKICDPLGNDCAFNQTCNPVSGENWGLCIAF